MKIIKIRTFPITLLVRPEFYIVSSAGSHPISKYVIVKMETDTGMVGWGEATVVPGWSGETQGGAEALINNYLAPIFLGQDISQMSTLVSKMESVIDNPFTKAAMEMALWDLLGKKENRPVYDLLGGAKNTLQIPIKFSIGLREPEETATIAAQKVAEGFTAIKIKVGPDSRKDLDRVRAVRQAIGPKVRLNLDVNGGWTVDQSIQEIPKYEAYNIEYVEQPTPRWDIDGLAKVRASTGVKIMADESVFSVWQAERVISKNAADLISIYPGKNGGISKSIEICKMAENAGVICHLGSNLEWDLGTAAMCHVAAACKNVQCDTYPVDILGPLYYATHPQQGGIQFKNGCVSVPLQPGLGINPTVTELEALAEVTK